MVINMVFILQNPVGLLGEEFDLAPLSDLNNNNEAEKLCPLEYHVRSVPRPSSTSLGSWQETCGEGADK